MAEPRSPTDTAVTAAPSQKRPLEVPSSPSAPTDGPNAKRPALDKETKESVAAAEVEAGAASTGQPGLDAEDELSAAAKDIASLVDQPELPTNPSGLPAPVESEKKEAGGAATNGHDTASADASGAAAAYHNQDESSWLHLRAIISSAEAATVIGKGGENVTQIRRIAGAKCTVSEYSRGAVERILTVSGPVDAVAKAYGLIIRTLNQEPLETASTPQSKTYPLRLLIPHILIGSIIGKQGVRIREIQEASGARLNASEGCLPLSTERSLVVLGVADAVHIATYYVGRTLVEQLSDRFGGPAASNYASRHGTTQGAMPGGMQVSPYVPMPAGGQLGHAEVAGGRGRGQQHGGRAPPVAAYGPQYVAAQPYHPQATMPYNAGSPRNPYANAAAPAPHAYAAPQQAYPQAAQQPMQAAPAYAGQPLTQQIYIPNDMVGAIIGKGGAKINEIRTLSGSIIKINEPSENSNERLVTVTGTAECNQMALYMLYSRLGESSKNSNSMMPR